MTYPTIWKDFGKFGVGFDDLFDRINEFHDNVAKNIPNYPPYNIKKTGDNTYVIEMAVAGFGKSDIEITTEEDKLIIDMHQRLGNKWAKMAELVPGR